MSHRRKNIHKSRHRTHAIKPANLPQRELLPLVVTAPASPPDQQTPVQIRESDESSQPAL